MNSFFQLCVICSTVAHMLSVANANDEVDLVLEHFPTTFFAIAWIDVDDFDASDDVPTPGGVLNFSDQRDTSAHYETNRFIRENIGELNRFGVERVWLSFNHLIILGGPKTAILPCRDPTGLCLIVTRAFQDRAHSVDVVEGAVIVRFDNSPVVAPLDAQVPDPWDGIRPFLAEQKRTTGYIHREIQYVVLAEKERGRWMNPFFESSPQFATAAQQFLPHVQYTCFTRTYPKRNYRITMEFDSDKSRVAGQAELARMLNRRDFGETGIGIRGTSRRLELRALTNEGERRIGKAVNAVRAE